jgi:hypothetical protein
VCGRAGFAACVLARSGRSGSLGHAMRDFCVMGDARALLKQLDKGRQPQHAVASVLARKGWTDAAAATSEVDRSYIVLAVNTLQAHTTLDLPPFSFHRLTPPLPHSLLFEISERSIQPSRRSPRFPRTRSSTPHFSISPPILTFATALAGSSRRSCALAQRLCGFCLD